jgi:hypothetical protein
MPLKNGCRTFPIALSGFMPTLPNIIRLGGVSRFGEAVTQTVPRRSHLRTKPYTPMTNRKAALRSNFIARMLRSDTIGTGHNEV